MKTLKIASLALALSLTAISTARAQATEADQAEAGAPDSILNARADASARVDPKLQNDQVAEAESGSPHAVDYGRRPVLRVDQRQLAQDLLAAEDGNPHAVRR